MVKKTNLNTESYDCLIGLRSQHHNKDSSFSVPIKSEEFKDFNKYIIEIEKKGAHKAGLAKFIPPPEWKPRADGYNMDIIGEIEIPAPAISQVVQGKQGVYQVFNIQKNAMKLKDLKRLINNAKHVTFQH